MELNEILKDNQLHEVLKQRNLDNENKAKRVLYKAILADNYFLARALICIQAYWQNNFPCEGKTVNN